MCFRSVQDQFGKVSDLFLPGRRHLRFLFNAHTCIWVPVNSGLSICCLDIFHIRRYSTALGIATSWHRTNPCFLLLPVVIYTSRFAGRVLRYRISHSWVWPVYRLMRRNLTSRQPTNGSWFPASIIGSAARPSAPPPSPLRGALLIFLLMPISPQAF